MRRDRLSRPLALGAVSVVAGLAATGCSWSGLGFFDDFFDAFEPEGAGDVTCGEWLDQSTDQQRTSVVDLIEDSEDDAVKDTLDDFEGAERDSFLDGIGDYITSQCESDGDDDTPIGQYVYEDF
jgi:hypothetical protein